MPALCANALAPTYGDRANGEMFVISLMAWAIRVSSGSPPGSPSVTLSTGSPYLSCRLATTDSRSAFPVRSPYPLTVPWTCEHPASTAASVLATAQPESLCAWMPRTASGPTAPRISCTMSATHVGTMPPLVSQRATTSAPASNPASTAAREYAGSNR